MNSRGSFLQGLGDALAVQTDISGKASVSFTRPWLRVEWSPSFDVRVGESAQRGSTDVLNTLGREVAWGKVTKDGVITEVRYSPRSDLSPDLQEVVVNTSKMLLLQVAQGYFTDARSASSNNSHTGNDVWGPNTRLISEGAPHDESRRLTVETKTILPSPTTMAGRGTFTIETKKLNLSLNGRQTLTNQLQLGSSQTDYKLDCEKSYETSSNDPSRATPLETTTSTPPWLVLDGTRSKHAAIQEKLGKKTIDQVIKEAKGFRKTKKGYEGVAEFSRKLQDFLFLHPEAAKNYYELALQFGPTHPLFDEILKALSQSGGPEAQKALLDLVDRFSKDPDVSKKTLIAVGMSTKPDATIAQALEKWGADPTFSEAPLANMMLGHVAHQMYTLGTDPARALAIDQSLVAKLQAAEADPEKSKWLSAIGNAGLCSDLEAIKTQMHAPTAYVAEGALMALRYCDGPEIQDLLWRVFTQRPELNQTFFSALNMREERGLPVATLVEQVIAWSQNPPTNTPDDIRTRTSDWLKRRRQTF